MDLGLRPQAYHLFRRVAELRPYEPQTYRAMAQALAAMGNTDLAIAYYEIPLQGRAGLAGSAISARSSSSTTCASCVGSRAAPPRRGCPTTPARASRRASREVNLRSADLLVTITWNTDNTDVDLHVFEPSGEGASTGTATPGSAAGSRRT